MRLLVIRDILGVIFELSEKTLSLALINNFFKKCIFLQNIDGSSGVAINLSHDMRKNNSVLFFGLVNKLVKDAILTNLKGTGLNLTVFLGV